MAITKGKRKYYLNLCISRIFWPVSPTEPVKYCVFAHPMPYEAVRSHSKWRKVALSLFISVAVYEIADLKSETASFYGFDGNLYVCDKDSRLHSAFFLMRRVKPLDFEHRRSGTTTPTGEV